MEKYYKVMLVETQKQMIHVYKNMLPWREYGFEVVSTTDTEMEAVSYYGEYHHDLVISDVHLKSGNGISLIKKLKHINPNCMTIVIAAQDDYDTVREAFLAGAADYLLKSRIRYSSLAALLVDVKKQIENNGTDQPETSWEVAVEKLLGLIRDKQKVDTDFLYEMLKRPELEVLNGTYRMLYFRQDNIKSFNRLLRQYDKPDWLNTEEFANLFRNKITLRDKIQAQIDVIIQEFIKEIPNARLLFTKKHSGLILLPAQISLGECQQLASQIIDAIAQRLTYEYSIVISEAVSGLNTFLSTYQKVMDYAKQKFYEGDGKIYCVDEGRCFQSVSAPILPYEDTIVQGIFEQDFQKVQHGYTEALLTMKQHNIDPKEVKAYFIGVLQRIEATIEKKGIVEKYPFDVLQDGIMETESIMFLQLELEKMCKTLIDWNKEHHVSKHHPKVAAMLEYIENHLHEKIALEQVAGAAGLSVTHAGRMFKHDVGSSVVEYINQCKMSKAEQLMHEENYKIKDIAKAVGIQDQLYFNKVFKKYYQLSPREYKKKL